MIMTHKVIVDCFHVNRKGHLHRLHTFSLLITERSTQLIQMMSAVVMRAAGCMSVSWSPAPTASTAPTYKEIMGIIIYHSTIWAMNYKSHVALTHNALWPRWSTQLMQISLKGLLFTRPAVCRRAAGHQHQCAVDMKPSKTSENV